MALTTESVIKIKGLTKKYYSKVVVNDINMEIPNSCFAFLGPNGAGKTNQIKKHLSLFYFYGFSIILLTSKREGFRFQLSYTVSTIFYLLNQF